MKTLHLLWMTCLLTTSTITAQNNSQEVIKKSKSTIDSIVSVEKETLKKKLSAVNQLLKEKKITEELSLQMKEELTATTEKHIKEKTAYEAEHLAKLIREQVHSNLEAKPLDTLAVTHKTEDYKQAMAEMEKIFSSKEDKKTYTDYSSWRNNIYTAIGVHNLSSSKGFGDNHFQTLGSRSFELGFTMGGRLLKNSNLLRVSGGIAWMHNGLKLKESEYFVRENDETKLVPYTANKLNKSKLRTNYLILPIDFEFDFTPKSTKKEGVIYPVHESFRVGFGAYAGIAIGDNQKIRYSDGDNTYKAVIRNDLNVTPFVYGLSAHIGYKIAEIYMRYSLTPLFRNNPVNEYPFSIGIRFK